MQDYRVTPRAGRWVAGQRVPASGVIRLTPKQAAYELALGNIEATLGKPERRRRK